MNTLPIITHKPRETKDCSHNFRSAKRSGDGFEYCCLDCHAIVEFDKETDRWSNKSGVWDKLCRIRFESIRIPKGHFECFLCEKVYPNEKAGASYQDKKVICQWCADHD